MVAQQGELPHDYAHFIIKFRIVATPEDVKKMESTGTSNAVVIF